MGRVIGGAVAGYVVIFLAVFGLMSAAWVLLGAEGAFRPGVWDVTGPWIAIMLAVSLMAAVLGGYVTASLARDPRGARLLVGIVVVLGIVFAIPVLTGTGETPPLPRPDQLPMFEAMQRGQQPTWVALMNPVLGAVGVLVGARLRSAPVA